MITKISGEQPFQVLTSAFSISPSASGYQLQISADGVNYSTLFSVGAGVTRLVTGVAANSYYKLAGNTSDVVVNWQKSCNGGEGGGGGTGTTITVDSELSTASTNPVENRVITNALNNLPSAEVDDELSSSSTHAVQNKVIYEALNGVPVATELVVLNTDSDWRIHDGNNFYNFKNTSIDKYKALNLANLQNNVCWIYLVDPDTNWRYFSNTTLTTNDVASTKYYYGNSGGGITFNVNNLDGTKEYYLLLNIEDGYAMFYKTLPTSITEISDHAALLSDVPTAQDNSDFKKFVYVSQNDNSKRVVGSLQVRPQMNISSTSRDSTLVATTNYWGGLVPGNVSTFNQIKGNECIDGVKTERDSQVISKAEEALSGLTEQVTLTIGNQSTDNIYLDYNYYNLYETDDTRYLVIPASATTNSQKIIGYLILSGTTYYIQNPMTSADYYRPVTGKYQLGVDQSEYFMLRNLPGNNYIIIDKELLTLEIAESLTITRAKNIQEMIDNIPQPDMSNYYTKAETDAEISAATSDLVSNIELTGVTVDVPIVFDGDAPYQNNIIYEMYAYNGEGSWYIHSQKTNVDNLVGFQLSDYANFTNAPYGVYIAYTKKSGYPAMEVSETITATTDTFVSQVPGSSLTTNLFYIIPSSLDGTYDYKVLYNLDDNTFGIFKNPSYQEEVQGVLDDYWTTGETQTAIEEALYGAIITGATTPVDDHLDSASTWPVENRVITNKFGEYYTKDETDAAITAATQNLASTNYVDAAITAATQNFVTSGDVTTAITSATQNFITSGDVTTIVDAAVATAITIDSALSTASTNPAENRVITTALNNKAEKANVATYDNQRVFPNWNSDGIITGKTGNVVYVVGHDINGVTYYILRDKNSAALPAIYAPTSGGTQGQVLISTGNGEPVWSNNNFVQSADVRTMVKCTLAEYNAMQSHDPNTFYIIVNS